MKEADVNQLMQAVLCLKSTNALYVRLALVRKSGGLIPWPFSLQKNYKSELTAENVQFKH